MKYKFKDKTVIIINSAKRENQNMTRLSEEYTTIEYNKILGFYR